MSDSTFPKEHGRSWSRSVSIGLLVALLVSGAAWALASPLFASPDDDQHLASVWCMKGYDTEECMPSGSEHLGREVVSVPALNDASTCFAFNPEQSAACQNGAAGTGTNNKDYPGGFYWVMSIFAGPDGERSALIMRLVSFALCMLMLAGSSLLLGERHLYRLSLVWAAVAVPLGWFLFSSNNPSGIAIAAETACFAATVSALRTSSQRLRWGSTAAAVGFAAIAAASRPDGLALSVLAVGLALVAGTRLPNHKVSGRVWALTAVAALAIVALALWTLTRVLPQSIRGAEVWNPSDIFAAIPDQFAFYFGQEASLLGWLDTAQPEIVVSQRIFTFGIVLAVALYQPTRRRLISLIFTSLVILFIPLVWNQSLGADVQIQPRYLLTLLLILAAIAVIDLDRSRINISRAQAMLIALAATTANAFALHTNIRRYVTGSDTQSFNLADNAEWWWSDFLLDPNWVWILGSLSFGVFALGVAWRAAEPPPVGVGSTPEHHHGETSMLETEDQIQAKSTSLS
jgi:hypothetical protein